MYGFILHWKKVFLQTQYNSSLVIHQVRFGIYSYNPITLHEGFALSPPCPEELSPLPWKVLKHRIWSPASPIVWISIIFAQVTRGGRFSSHRDKCLVPFKKTGAKTRSGWSAATPGQLPVASPWGLPNSHHVGKEGPTAGADFHRTHPTGLSLPTVCWSPLIPARKGTAFPDPLSIPSWWWLQISHDGRSYTTEISKHCKPGPLFVFSGEPVVKHKPITASTQNF